MAKKPYNKPSKYITFASGWMRLDEEGSITSIRCSAEPKANSKANKGEGYKVFVYPVDESGDIIGDPVEVTNFVMTPTNVDKSQYENAPDFRVFFGVE